MMILKNRNGQRTKKKVVGFSFLLVESMVNVELLVSTVFIEHVKGLVLI